MTASCGDVCCRLFDSLRENWEACGVTNGHIGSHTLSSVSQMLEQRCWKHCKKVAKGGGDGGSGRSAYDEYLSGKVSGIVTCTGNGERVIPPSASS